MEAGGTVFTSMLRTSDDKTFHRNPLLLRNAAALCGGGQVGMMNAHLHLRADLKRTTRPEDEATSRNFTELDDSLPAHALRFGIVRGGFLLLLAVFSHTNRGMTTKRGARGRECQTRRRSPRDIQQQDSLDKVIRVILPHRTSRCSWQAVHLSSQRASVSRRLRSHHRRWRRCAALLWRRRDLGRAACLCS